MSVLDFLQNFHLVLAPLTNAYTDLVSSRKGLSPDRYFEPPSPGRFVFNSPTSVATPPPPRSTTRPRSTPELTIVTLPSRLPLFNATLKTSVASPFNSKHGLRQTAKSPNNQPDVLPNSQYGVMNTQSYLQCNGINGTHPNDYEVLLSTNTSLSNYLKGGKFYFITGKLITTGNGKPPVITYNQNAATCVPIPKGTSIDMINKLAIVGLGHFVLREEVLTEATDVSLRLEVIVAHNDWDSRAKSYQSYQVKYLVPGTKNLQGTFNIYQPGQEVQVTGHVIDFNLTNHMPIAMVNYVALTTGHGLSSLGMSAGSPTNVKFNGTLSEPVSGPSGSCSKPIAPSAIIPNQPTADSTLLKTNGKQPQVDLNEATTEESGESNEEEEPQVPLPPPEKKARGCPRNDILKAAAKRMKRT
ncbi:hypothetical protein PCANC_20595 [Puccinia coronata f. sp. avenae]|uniref:Uncharacterized protein n=1 Tax=Puccinia coronata f. sp. avenae TaxID=200324 RepID=A0A2N5T4V1_9BASI|nr:hypothetical protein PCANC_20595 [Puccinia coronata f. sp. avenae]